MSAIANIVVADAAATPVNHTFVPTGFDGNGLQARYMEKSTATPQGWWELKSMLKAPVGKEATFKYSLSFKMPTLKSYTDLSGNAVTVVDYYHAATLIVHLPIAGTLQNRKDFRKMLAGILGDAQIIDNVENLNSTY